MATNATIPPSILLPDPATVIGPMFIGSLINWLLMGTLIVQVYYFRLEYANDRFAIKALVYLVVALDIVQTVFGTHQAWFYAIANWNNGPALVGPSPWSAATIPIMAGLVSGIVQLFYAWRIWILSSGGPSLMKGMACLIVLLALAQSLTAIITSIVIEFDPTQTNLLHLHPAFSFWLAGSFTVDILISGSMISILYKARSLTSWSRSERMIDRLIINAIQTGTITVICAGVDLALFIRLTSNNYHLAPAYILGKLYSNSLLTTLNARKSSMSKVSGASTAASDTIGMRVQVSRVAERNDDSTLANRSEGKFADFSRGMENDSRLDVKHSVV